MTQVTVQTTAATSEHTNISLLCPKHRQALLDRGLSADWIETNCRSLTLQEASQYLGYPAKSAGILLKGQDIQIQFKPDKPWKKEGDKKAAKYRSPLGDYDAMLPINPDGSWLTRRILMMGFERKPDKIRDLEKEFEPELSAFTNYLLSIPNEEITRVLRGLGKGDIQKPLWESQIRTDSIAAWVNEWVIYDTSAKTLIGSNRNEWSDTAYNPHASTLFGSYSHYCKNTGLQAKGKNNFSSDLIELCQQTLSWSVSYCRGSNGERMIRGLRLRTEGDTDPTLEDKLTNDNSDNLTDNISDNLKPLSNKDSDNFDNQKKENFSSIIH